MEILISITAKMAEYTVKPIGRQLGYLYYYKNNIRNLDKQVEMLKLTRESVRNRVIVAERNAEVMDDVVKNWFNEADGIINSCEMLIHVNEGQESKRYCSSRVCLNLVQRHRVSRKAKKMTAEVLEIKTNGNFVKVSHEVPLSNGKLKVSGFMSFGSRESIITQIMDSLMDDNVNTIGMYGMGGAGKTMLAKEIIRRVIENKSFEEAVMSTVSQTHDFKRIQGELSDMLGLKFEQETIQGRANKLHMRLKIEKKILIVLDDIWEDIDLDKIGIPTATNHKGCKILFTSRDKNILSSMGTNFIIEVKDLEQKESWNLFKEMAGEIVEQSDLKLIAVEIVKECAHLPIAIATIARALKSKPLPIWRDALNQLKNHKVMNIKGMNDKVYTSLELSYKHLDSREAKSVFLLCSMFPEDHRINVEDLHVYAMGMGLLMDIDTLAEGRDRTLKLVDDLKSSSLLQETEFGNGYVKMHDIVRDVAILIASKDDQIRTLSYVHGLNEWQEEKISGNYTAAYLHFGNSPNPPQKLMLPNIQLLMFTGQYDNKPEFSETFSEEMKELKVLELNNIRISLSPPSLHSFANLRSLRLHDCELKDVDMSSVELNKLEILSFRRSNITEIPKVISQSGSRFAKIRGLKIISCDNLEIVFPSNMMSILNCLEDLTIWYCKSLKGIFEEPNETEQCDGLLPRLRYLALHSLPNLKYVWSKDPQELQIFENVKNISIKECPKLRRVYPVKVLQQFRELEMEYGELMKNLENVAKSMKVIMDETHSHKGELWEGEVLLPKLETLKLWGSLNYKPTHFPKQLVRIFLNLRFLDVREVFIDEIFPNCPIAQMPTLRNLGILIIHKCNGLTHLLNPQLAATLVRLQHMQLRGCKMMTSVISQGSTDEEEEIVFTKLERIELVDLPRLTSFHSGKCIIGFPYLKCVTIENCPEMKVFSLGTATTPCLRNTSVYSSGFIHKDSEGIIVEDINTIVGEAWENTYDIQHWYTGQVLHYDYLEYLKFEFAYGFWKMICPNEILGCSLAKIKRIEITQCNNLEKVFPSYVMSILECVEHIKIKSCRLLERIFEDQDSNVERDEKYDGLLPQLISLELMNLPNLKYVWREDPQELQIFENMKEIYIHQCPKFKRVFPQQLESLGIEYGELIEALNNPCESSETTEIVALRDGPDLLPTLEDLEVSGSILNYKSIHFPMGIVPILHSLKNLEVREIFVEEIFPNCPNAQSHTLEWLELYKLPKLRHLWKENSQMNTLMLPSLKYLRVEECGRLNSIVPSSSSVSSKLRNLRHLIIHKCHGLTHLLNPHMATTLVQLQYMKLSECKMMTTLIAHGLGDGEEIIFPELKYLVIVDLPRLTSFHSGKYIFRFPCLVGVEIIKCPEMKVFSKGVTTTPCLEKSVLWWSDLEKEEEDDIPEDSKDVMVEDINVILRQAWENIYDSSIQHLFTENASLPDLDYTQQYTPSGFRLWKSRR